MSHNQPSWIWSKEHNNHYCVTLDNNGNYVYTWYSEPSAASQPSTSQAATTQTAGPQETRNDSVVGGDIVAPPPVPWETRANLPNFIAGTPDKGWYDELDHSYRMRTGGEARQFFKKGRVFATLYTETTGGTAQSNIWNDSYTTVKYGQSAFTQIRRFVVVSVRRNFVYACAIATYSKKGTLKPGCNPGEHAVIYSTGTDPRTCYFEGECRNGLYKEPIEVEPADETGYLTPESRIRFGKAYAIEWNIKVKDIGMVAAEDMAKLLRYFKDEDREVF